MDDRTIGASAIFVDARPVSRNMRLPMNNRIRPGGWIGDDISIDRNPRIKLYTFPNQKPASIMAGHWFTEN
jgi:hypothetical protein